MKNLSHHIAALAITAWVGSLWAISYIAAPVLFYAQPDKQLAGMLAGHMFVNMNHIGLICGAYLLAYFLGQFKQAAIRMTLFRVTAVMLLITLIMLFGFEPVMNHLKVQALPLDVIKSEFAGQFKILHGISQIFSLIESLLGVYLVIKSPPLNTSRQKLI